MFYPNKMCSLFQRHLKPGFPTAGPATLGTGSLTVVGCSVPCRLSRFLASTPRCLQYPLPSSEDNEKHLQMVPGHPQGKTARSL